MEVLTLLGTMVALAAIGLPLVFAILAACLATLLIFRPGLPLEVLPQLFVNGMDRPVLLAIVFFFLAGELMNRGGITRRIIDFASALVGHVRGGLGQVNVVSSIFFSGITGSAVADTAAIGTVMIPSMVRKGYAPGFAAAVTQTSSVIGPIIPPSIPMIVYAVMAEVSVGQMFLGGILPGLVIGAVLMLVVLLISVRRGYPVERRASAGDVVRTGLDAAVALGTPLIIVGGILGGVFTATEAGAVAVLYSLLAGALFYRELDLPGLWAAIVRAAEGTATVLVILGASSIFAWIVADLRVHQAAASLLFALGREPWLVLLAINLLVLVVGLFMDPLAALVILVPILLPAAAEIGVDPVHFGVMIVINLMIGLTTPPVGYLIYLSADIAEVPPEVVIRESLPFLGALLVALGICAYVPAVTLALPSLLR
ncbi:MAG TPA: TRAP transporter large permease [Geminicoccaceae bacterium]